MERKNAIYAGLAALIVISASYLAYTRFRTAPDSALSGTGSATSTVASGTEKKAALSLDTGGNHAGLTYGEAVNYYDGRRIQFTADCTAIPNRLSLRNGTTVMFDNRAPESRTIALDGRRYVLRGYDFRLLVLESSRLPHTVAVDCGTGRNNAGIILQ